MNITAKLSSLLETFFQCFTSPNYIKTHVHFLTRALDAQLGGQQKKIDDHVAQLCDYENVNKRMAAENGTLFTRLEELNGNAGMLQKIKVTLSSQLDDAKRACDEEAKERQSLLGR